MSRIRGLIKDVSAQEKIVFLIGIVGYAIIVYKYRIQMGDFGDFAKAGKLIWANEDPYSQLMYVNSPVSAVIVYGLSKVLPFIFIPFFWQVMNILGLVLFIQSVVNKSYHHLIPIALSIFAFLNVARALFANVQVTGLVLGLIAIGIKLSKKKKSTLISMLPFWLAAEIKPQLAIGFILVLLFQGRIQFLRVFILSLYVLVSHALLEIKFSGDINRLWIEKLIKYSSASLKEGYEISFWKIIAVHTEQILLVRITSLLAVVSVLCAIILMSLKLRTDLGLYFAMIFPLLNSYLHLYDLALLSLCVVLGALMHREAKLLLATLAFLQIYPLTLQGQILSLLIFGVFAALTPLSESIKIVSFKLIAPALLMSLLITYFVTNESQELQIAETLVFPLMVILMFSNKRLTKMFNKI
jgi:hypothetical protein